MKVTKSNNGNLFMVKWGAFCFIKWNDGRILNASFIDNDKKLFGIELKIWKLKRLKRQIVDAVKCLRVWPVYAVYWSRDCDMCESSSAYKFPTYWHYLRFVDDAYSWAEGPFGCQIVTKKEYLQHEGYFRDRALEAFENGNQYAC